MAISINRNKSGFRKWSKAHELKKPEKTGADASESGRVAALDVDQDVIKSNETPHRPWLVPGAGRL
jgi:hypothetical protein